MNQNRSGPNFPALLLKVAVAFVALLLVLKVMGVVLATLKTLLYIAILVGIVVLVARFRKR
jgi:hypothetical protein